MQKTEGLEDWLKSRWQIYLYRWFSIKILMLRSNTAHLHSTDKSAEPPQEQRPRLWVERSPTPQHKKKRSPCELLFWVPYDVLFSNDFLRDLSRLWSLRDILPDPENMPWRKENWNQSWFSIFILNYILYLT